MYSWFDAIDNFKVATCSDTWTVIQAGIILLSTFSFQSNYHNGGTIVNFSCSHSAVMKAKERDEACDDHGIPGTVIKTLPLVTIWMTWRRLRRPGHLKPFSAILIGLSFLLCVNQYRTCCHWWMVLVFKFKLSWCPSSMQLPETPKFCWKTPTPLNLTHLHIIPRLYTNPITIL